MPQHAPFNTYNFSGPSWVFWFHKLAFYSSFPIFTAIFFPYWSQKLQVPLRLNPGVLVNSRVIKVWVRIEVKILRFHVKSPLWFVCLLMPMVLLESQWAQMVPLREEAHVPLKSGISVPITPSLGILVLSAPCPTVCWSSGLPRFLANASWILFSCLALSLHTCVVQPYIYLSELPETIWIFAMFSVPRLFYSKWKLSFATRRSSAPQESEGKRGLILVLHP